MTENDFVRYIKAMQNKCSAETNCEDCEFVKICDAATCINDKTEFNPDDFIQAVDKWCKENPVETYLQHFLKQFPNIKTQVNGIPLACRNNIYFNGKSCEYIWSSVDCEKCWKEKII